MAFTSSCLRTTKLVGVVLFLVSLSMLTGQAVSAAQDTAPKQQQAQDHPEFPAGDGRDTTLRLCSKCHSVNNLLATGRDRQGWEDIIIKMVSLGMKGTDEDFSEIADYLTASFPPTYGAKINVNKADAKQLLMTLVITADEAKEIVAYREKNGDFKTFDDLKKVPNVDAKKLDAKKDKIQF
jgi:competence protein ComEA